jgi:hypothetical protein
MKMAFSLPLFWITTVAKSAYLPVGYVSIFVACSTRLA